MKIFKNLFSPIYNCEEIAVRLCKQLKVEVTQTTLIKDLINHPDYPSLSSISDVFKDYGVETLALKTTIENFKNLPMPFIVQVRGTKNNGDLFAIVNDVKAESINWYNPESTKNETVSTLEFEKRYKGYVQIAEKGDSSGERGYRIKRRIEKIKKMHNVLLSCSIPLLVLLVSVITLRNVGFSVGFMPVVYTLITLLGVLIGVVLLWYEVDQNNPALQKVCHAGKNVDCAAVLHSKASGIFGVSWASIGFTYYSGVLFALLIGGIASPEFLFVAAWLNVLALPYTFFSIYYQAFKIKKWCLMCLSVQLLLVLQFVIALFGGFHTIIVPSEIGSAVYFSFIIGFIFLFVAVQLLFPALKKSNEGKNKKTELRKIKYNPQVFRALLSGEKRLTESTDGLGLKIGKADAKIKIIKVCNPYCSPCAQAHPIIDELLSENPDIQLQIIFTATEDETDYRNPPVKHLLDIAESGDEGLLKNALNDWYLAKQKDYSVFAKNYQLHGELALQDEKIIAMREWCKKVEIAFTPTFFLNGYQLPEMYSVKDLKYFLSV